MRETACESRQSSRALPRRLCLRFRAVVYADSTGHGPFAGPSVEEFRRLGGTRGSSGAPKRRLRTSSALR